MKTFRSMKPTRRGPRITTPLTRKTAVLATTRHFAHVLQSTRRNHDAGGDVGGGNAPSRCATVMLVDNENTHLNFKMTPGVAIVYFSSLTTANLSCPFIVNA